MKKGAVFFIMILSALFLLTGCDTEGIVSTESVNSLSSIPKEVIDLLPEDIVLDELITDDGFDFSTIRNLPVKISLSDADGHPVSKAVITVNGETGSEITRAVTNDQGVAEFSVTSDAVESSLEIVVEHPEYETREISVSNVETLSKVNRQIYAAGITAPPPPDSDNDGIPDYLDLFPFDADIVAYSAAEFTVAFEDLYPKKGDADFNDVVASLRFMEFFNDKNEVVKISVTSQILAAGAGYLYNKLLINILGQEYVLVENTKTAINGQHNSKPGEIYFEALPVVMELRFDVPVSRQEIAPFPYDPFVRVQDEAGREVHLPFVETPFQGAVLDEDAFPWAIVIPKNWCWPYEQQDIRQAYPQFEAWYTSAGTLSKDWYNYPEVGFVYNKGI